MCAMCARCLIKDELTRKLDRYNGTKLRRMYKLTNQNMLQMYKVCSCFGVCDKGMVLRVCWMCVIGDSRIVGYLDGENGMLCVHVIGYKRGYKLWHIIQDGIWYKLGYKQ